MLEIEISDNIHCIPPVVYAQFFKISMLLSSRKRQSMRTRYETATVNYKKITTVTLLAAKLMCLSHETVLG